MKQPPQRYKVLRAFEYRGRIYGSGERVLLADELAEALLVAGYVELSTNGTPVLVQPGAWVEPVTR